MIIEFVGCTGAGKSTLATSMTETLMDQGIETVDANEFVLSNLLHGAKITSAPSIILIHLFAYFAVAANIRSYWAFCVFAWKMVREHEPSPRIMVNFYRNVVKRVGIYELIRKRNTGDKIVIFDEGTVQTAHSLFVHLYSDAKLEDVNRFSDLVPRPDVIVYVNAPLPVVLERTLARPRRSLIIEKQSKIVIESYLIRAQTVYGYLVHTDAIRERCLMIDGDLSDPKVFEASVERIKNFVLCKWTISNGPSTSSERSAAMEVKC